MRTDRFWVTFLSVTVMVATFSTLASDIVAHAMSVEVTEQIHGDYWNDHTGSNSCQDERRAVTRSDGMNNALMDPTDVSEVIIKGKATAYNVNLTGDPDNSVLPWAFIWDAQWRS